MTSDLSSSDGCTLIFLLRVLPSLLYTKYTPTISNTTTQITTSATITMKVIETSSGIIAFLLPRVEAGFSVRVVSCVLISVIIIVSDPVEVGEGIVVVVISCVVVLVVGPIVVVGSIVIGRLGRMIHASVDV